MNQVSRQNVKADVETYEQFKLRLQLQKQC